MPKGKGKGKKNASPPKHSSSGSSAAAAPPALQAEYEEMILTFDDDPPPFEEYQPDFASSSGAGSSGSGSAPAKKKSVKSNQAVHLQGPLDVDGSVKSMASIQFDGDFAIRDKIEAYGNIDVNGNLTCVYVSSLSVSLPSFRSLPLPLFLVIASALRGELSTLALPSNHPPSSPPTRGSRGICRIEAHLLTCRSDKVKSFGNVNIAGTFSCQWVATPYSPSTPDLPPEVHRWETP